MDIYILAIIAFIALLLMFTPIGTYLIFGWKDREQEIFGLFSREAIKLYFRTFFPRLSRDPGAPEPNYESAFHKLYWQRYGRRKYVVPIVILSTIILGAFAYIFINRGLMFPSADIPQDAQKGRYFLTVMAAFWGAYFFVVYDLIKRERANNLSPFHLCQASLRIGLAIPLGLVLAVFVEANLAPALAFLLGAFPINDVLRIMRYLARRGLKIGEEEKEKTPGLIELQGVDLSIANQFEVEGIATIEQLAYSDPVDITLRTGQTFMFIIDVISQALAWVYLEKDMITARRYSIRGALEIQGLFKETDSEDEDPGKRRDREIAWIAMRKLAERLSYPAEVMERTLRSVLDDPRYKYLHNLFENLVVKDEADRTPH